MSYLLDTNVVSEWVKSRPNPSVVAWLADLDEDRAFLSVATYAELRGGVERLAEGARRSRLLSWLEEDLPGRFENRVLKIDQPIAHAWGQLIARSLRTGVALGVMDAFFAATAEVHGLTLVTRNTRDFEMLGIALLNPWIPG